MLLSYEQRGWDKTSFAYTQTEVTELRSLSDRARSDSLAGGNPAW